jgi:enoyl-CoA hydratase
MELSNGFTIERERRLAVIRFVRPAIRNPLSVAVLDGLIEAIPTLSAKALVITGSEDVFASGAHLREVAGVDGSNAAEFAERGQRLMSLIASRRARTIAAVNGYCYGGALDLALACDSRIASPNAEFCHPGARLGIMTGWGGTQRLPRLIGESAALEMFLTGKRVSAVEALSINLVDAIANDPVGAAIEACP